MVAVGILQNATAPTPTPELQSLVIFNVNYALLFLVLSGAYMILNGRKALFSTRIQDLKEWGNVFHYVAIAVVQALFITIIQNWLESWTKIKFVEFSMTFILLLALAVENWVIENR